MLLFTVESKAEFFHHLWEGTEWGIGSGQEGLKHSARGCQDPFTPASGRSSETQCYAVLVGLSFASLGTFCCNKDNKGLWRRAGVS